MTEIDESDIKIAYGQLLQQASGPDNLPAKQVLTKLDPLSNRTASYKALNSFPLPVLESTAAFLGIELADSDSNKIFTKDSLVTRLLSGIKALLPASCIECSEKYTVERKAKTAFVCFRCFQGSHACQLVTTARDALAEVTLLSGHIWLCSKCTTDTNPVKPRKSKSRHNSLRGEDPALQKIRDEFDAGRQLRSPGNSPERIDDGDTERKKKGSSRDKSASNRRDDDVSTREICPRYKQWKCPHGLRGTKVVDGKKCEFDHPRHCFRFTRFGTIERKGCSKGQKCEFYHPKLCKNWSREGGCGTSDCTFLHPKVKKKPKARDQKNVKKADANSKSSAKSKPKPMTPKSSSNSNDFLELKGLLMQLNANLVKSSMMQNQPWQSPSPNQSLLGQLLNSTMTQNVSPVQAGQSALNPLFSQVANNTLPMNLQNFTPRC